MAWYIFIFSICVIVMILHSTIKNEILKKVLEVSTLILLALFSGTRYRLGGYDYNIYEEMYNNVPMLSKFNINFVNIYGSDIFYRLFNSLIKTLGFSFYGFTLIESTLFFVLLYKGIKKYNINFGFFIIVFLYKLYIFNTFVSLRQSIVLVVFFNAIEYLIDKKRVKYIITILLCSLVHASALILLPLVFIDKINLTKKQIVIYSLIFFILFIINILGIYEFNPKNIIQVIFANNNTILNKSEQYLNAPTGINILSTLECYLIICFLIIKFNKIYVESNMEQKIMINLFLIIIPIVTFFRSIEVMIRIRDYFYLAMPFVLYYISNCFKSRDKILINGIIVAICFIGFYRYVYTYGGLVPYVSYITENVNIFNK